MSAWLIALGLAAGYLMQKNVQVRSRLEAVTKQFHSEAQPESKGPSSEVIRTVQRTVPDSEKYQDMNVQDLNRKEVDHLVSEREAAAQEVVNYETAVRMAPIEGVYLHYDRNGV